MVEKVEVGTAERACFTIKLMLTTQDKHNLGCQIFARLEGQTSTGYDWERAV